MDIAVWVIWPILLLALVVQVPASAETVLGDYFPIWLPGGAVSQVNSLPVLLARPHRYALQIFALVDLAAFLALSFVQNVPLVLVLAEQRVEMEIFHA